MARQDGSPSLPAEPASSGAGELAGYAFEALQQEGEWVLFRAWRDGERSSVLAVAPGRQDVSAPSLEHEFSLRAQLPAAPLPRASGRPRARPYPPEAEVVVMHRAPRG